MATYYKTTYTLEVLSDHVPRIMTLDQLAYQWNEGYLEGRFTQTTTIELTPQELVEVLDELGLEEQNYMAFPNLEDDLAQLSLQAEDIE